MAACSAPSSGRISSSIASRSPLNEERGAKLGSNQGLDELVRRRRLGVRRRELRREVLEEPSLAARQRPRERGLVLRDEARVGGAVTLDDLPRGRDEERLDLRGRDLLEPRHPARDPRRRTGQPRHLHGLGLLHERRRHDDPRLVLREHARAQRRRGDRELDVLDPELTRDAIEQEAGRVTAARR